MKKFLIAAGVAALSLASTAQAASITAYSNDFDGAEVFASGVTGGLSGYGNIVSKQNLPAPFAGNILRNDSFAGSGFAVPMALASILTLNNLPTHDSIDINFLVAFIDSWDGSSGSFPQNDHLYIAVDGNVIFDLSAINQSGNASPDNLIGLSLGPITDYGFNGGYVDSARDMSGVPALNYAHTASSLTLMFVAGGVGWQGGSDESWGIDNLNVQLVTRGTDVPEPAALGLLGLGLAGLGIARKRRAR